MEDIVDRIVGTHLSLDLISFPQDSILSGNQRGAIRCGDNGIFCGVAGTEETRILTSVANFIYDGWHTDGKYIISTHGTVANPRRDLVICQSYLKAVEAKILKARLIDKYGFDQVTINPLGYWTGGPDVDCGATNRKLGSDMGQAVTGGGLHGKDLSKADVSVNIWCHLEAIRTGHQVIKACCAIGDETVNGVPYSEIVETARAYIKQIGGFEKFAEWGLIRPLIRP